MVAKGLSIYKIAEELGVSVSTASHDVCAVRQIWAEDLKAEINVVRGQAVAEYQHLINEALTGWEHSKKEGRYSEKLLTAAGSLMKERNKLMGLGLDVSVVQNNVAINGEASADQVIGAFAPMNADEYQSFINEKGPLTALPPVPVTDEENETIEIDSKADKK